MEMTRWQADKLTSRGGPEGRDEGGDSVDKVDRGDDSLTNSLTTVTIFLQ